MVPLIVGIIDIVINMILSGAKTVANIAETIKVKYSSIFQKATNLYKNYRVKTE
jgi:hypothetical protein